MSPGGRHVGLLAWVLGAIVVAALSLLVVPFAPAYDPWAWIVWGREASSLDLDTSGGPAFKPLTVLLTTPLAAAGDAAPELWLLVARAAGILAIVLAATLAARLARPRGDEVVSPAVAGLVAVVALVLTPAEDARHLRYVAQGLSEPLCVALVLGAVHRHLDGRSGQALALAVGAGLIRPEAWALAAAYVVWTASSGRLDPRLALAGLAAMPVVWFGGDLLGSGSAVTGADRARQEEVSGTSAFEDALGMVILPVWVLAGALLARAAARRRARDDVTLLVLGGGAAVWAACVWAMAVALDYAADPRFFLPAAGVVCVLAGVGAARGLAALRARAMGAPRRAWLAAGAVVLVSVPFAADRVDAIVSDHWDLLEIREEVQLELAATLAAVDGGLLARCGTIFVEGRETALEAPTRAAWELDVPLVAIRPSLGPGGRGVAVLRRDRERAARLADAHSARLLARTPGWDAYAVRCR